MNTIKKQPATPLPWSVAEERLMRQQQAAQGAIPVFAHSTRYDDTVACFDLRGVEAATLRSDAAYIAHAANAYPKLVEALKTLHDSKAMNAWGHEICRSILRELGEEV